MHKYELSWWRSKNNLCHRRLKVNKMLLNGVLVYDSHELSEGIIIILYKFDRSIQHTGTASDVLVLNKKYASQTLEFLRHHYTPRHQLHPKEAGIKQSMRRTWPRARRTPKRRR